MMDILYRSKPPAYRGSCSPPPQASTGWLSGIWCNLFGGGGGNVPAYRTTGKGKNGSAAPTDSRCWWQAFPSAPTYKTAPEESADPVSGDPSPDGDPDPDCGCPEGVVANEIYLE